MPRRKGWTKPSFLLSTQLTAHTDVSKHAANIPEEVAKVESLEDEPTAYTQPPDCTNHRAEVPASPDALPDDTRSERAACFGPGTLLRLHQVGTVAGVPCPVEAVSLYDRVLVEGRKWATVTQIFRIAYTGELARFGTRRVCPDYFAICNTQDFNIFYYAIHRYLYRGSSKAPCFAS